MLYFGYLVSHIWKCDALKRVKMENSNDLPLHFKMLSDLFKNHSLVHHIFNHSLAHLTSRFCKECMTNVLVREQKDELNELVCFWNEELGVFNLYCKSFFLSASTTRYVSTSSISMHIEWLSLFPWISCSYIFPSRLNPPTFLNIFVLFKSPLISVYFCFSVQFCCIRWTQSGVETGVRSGNCLWN